ncbi:MAG: hypothetical protein RXQ62_04020 [Nitrososphaeria archaeon]|jgi:hypothetical protein
MDAKELVIKVAPVAAPIAISAALTLVLGVPHPYGVVGGGLATSGT